jgi:hypothetical protein
MAVQQQVHDRVAQILAGLTGTAPPPCDAEPVCFRAGSAAVYVRLLDCTPAIVRVFSPVLREVDVSPALLQDLNLLNASCNFVRFFYRDGTIFAATEHLAETLDEPELVHACQLVADLANHHDDLLLERHGGSTSFGPVELQDSLARI